MLKPRLAPQILTGPLRQPSASAHFVSRMAILLALAGCEDTEKDQVGTESGMSTSSGGVIEMVGPNAPKNSTTDDSTGTAENPADTSSSTGSDLSTGEVDSTGPLNPFEPYCGNGLVEEGEVCDDYFNNGHYGGCEPGCQEVAAHCGDGELNGTEKCDDGNDDNTDYCLDTCQLPSCGDAFVQVGIEECDDGNEDNSDACMNSCKNASCGDHYVWVGEMSSEQCDDGNKLENDACLNNCTLPKCGDGVKNGYEQCDDGNKNDNDACGNDCKP